MFDKLVLPFRFIPDGSPEALEAPPPDHIRIRARFVPAASSEAAAEETDDARVDPAGVQDAVGDQANSNRVVPAREHDEAFAGVLISEARTSDGGALCTYSTGLAMRGFETFTVVNPSGACPPTAPVPFFR